MTLEWGRAGSPMAGETSSGDRGVIAEFPGGTLVAVIDGLGHGKEACAAALAAERVLLAEPGAPVEELVTRCHHELRGTRGVVISVASLDDQHRRMSWLGVGNVEGLLVRGTAGSADEAVAMRGGTVGYLLPRLHPRTLALTGGDTLVLATDGIRHGFKCEVLASRAPQQIADAIVANWGKATDDSCVVVARYAATQEAA